MRKESIKSETKKKINILLKIFFIILLLRLYILKSLQNVKTNVNINSIQTSINNKNASEGRIFICTLYNNEAEMAYIHIWRLYDYVDKFIIVTSNITHSGFPKNISFRPFEREIKPFMNKIDIINFNNICDRKEYPNSNFFWCIEQSQRDYAKTYIEANYNPTEKDFLIVVDMDEILTKEGILYIKNNFIDNFKFIKGSYYFPYYYHKILDWDKSFIVRYNREMKTLSKYRTMKRNNSDILRFKYNPSKPLITHCSYCFKNIDEYKIKLTSFAHQEYNKKPYITNNWIFKSHYCREIFNNSKEYDEPYEGWKHLIPSDERLKFLIDRSFMYMLNQTTYTEKDLENLCNKNYNRTPFELSAKYKL